MYEYVICTLSEWEKRVKISPKRGSSMFYEGMIWMICRKMPLLPIFLGVKTSWDIFHCTGRHILFGGIPTPLKNISQLGWLFPTYGKSKMFQTTNQYIVVNYWYILTSQSLTMLWRMLGCVCVSNLGYHSTLVSLIMFSHTMISSTNHTMIIYNDFNQSKATNE